MFFGADWWGSASQGGRIMGRFLMMYEEGLLTAKIQMKFILLQARPLDRASSPMTVPPF